MLPSKKLLLAIAAIVALFGVAILSPQAVSAGRALLDWEDDLRPRSGAYSSDSDYALIDVRPSFLSFFCSRRHRTCDCLSLFLSLFLSFFLSHPLRSPPSHFPFHQKPTNQPNRSIIRARSSPSGVSASSTRVALVHRQGEILIETKFLDEKKETR